MSSRSNRHTVGPWQNRSSSLCFPPFLAARLGILLVNLSTAVYLASRQVTLAATPASGKMFFGGQSHTSLSSLVRGIVLKVILMTRVMLATLMIFTCLVLVFSVSSCIVQECLRRNDKHVCLRASPYHPVPAVLKPRAKPKSLEGFRLTESDHACHMDGEP